MNILNIKEGIYENNDKFLTSVGISKIIDKYPNEFGNGNNSDRLNSCTDNMNIWIPLTYEKVSGATTVAEMGFIEAVLVDILEKKILEEPYDEIPSNYHVDLFTKTNYKSFDEYAICMKMIFAQDIEVTINTIRYIIFDNTPSNLLNIPLHIRLANYIYDVFTYQLSENKRVILSLIPLSDAIEGSDIFSETIERLNNEINSISSDTNFMDKVLEDESMYYDDKEVEENTITLYDSSNTPIYIVKATYNENSDNVDVSITRYKEEDSKESE